MSGTSGFWISELRIIGAKVPPASISFVDGANVIAGASDTGKSYIQKCINYMLGGEDPPKSVPEDAGYDTALLEITTRAEEQIVLRRSLKKKGNFQLYRTSLASWSKDGPSTTLNWKHNPKRDDNVSAMLLMLSDLYGVMIRTSAIKTRSLSFRDPCRFMLIDESDIIAEHSPVNPSGQFVLKTAEKSIFDFLVSGEDSSSVVVGANVTIKKAGWRAKVELFDQLIDDLRSRTSEPRESVVSRLQKNEEAIQTATEQIVINNEAIASAARIRLQVWQAIQKASFRIDVIEQLLSRFVLLRQHYESDLARLRFLSEGDFFLSQLGDGHCPLCGSIIGKHTTEQIAKDLQTRQTIQQASTAESNKIAVQIQDLNATVDSLTAEREESLRTVSELQSELARSQESLRTELEPRIASSREELRQLIELRNTLQVFHADHGRLEDLIHKRQNLGGEPKASRNGKDKDAESTVGELSGRRKLCDIVQSLLEDWKYDKAGVVEFNQTMDMVVGAVPRKSHGKGIRAILQSAFSIALMRHATARHPGFIVLDSPLTSFKEKDRLPASEDVQAGFFEYLSAATDIGQIIILENKDPPAHLRDKLNFTHFSGKQGVGRAGFFPT